MILNHEKWNHPLIITPETPTVIIINDLLEFYQFQKGMIEQMKTGEGYLSIFDDNKPLKIEKDIEIIPNIFTLSLNNRKAINYLHKNVTENIGKSDHILTFESIKKALLEWIRNVREETLLDFVFEDEIEIIDFLKILDVKFQDRDDTPIELLIRYLDLLIQISKIKVIFTTFASYYLSKNDLEYLLDYCRLNDIIIVLLEKEKPKIDTEINHIVMVADTVLI